MHLRDELQSSEAEVVMILRKWTKGAQRTMRSIIIEFEMQRGSSAVLLIATADPTAAQLHSLMRGTFSS